MIKICIRIIFTLFSALILLSCSNFCYKKDNLNASIKEEYLEEQTLPSSNSSSYLEAYRNDNFEKTNETENSFHATKGNQIKSITKQTRQVYSKQTPIISVPVKVFETKKHNTNQMHTELYDNISFLSTSIGILSILFSFIAFNLGIFFGVFSIILGTIGIVGIKLKGSYRFKKSIRLSILGVFYGFLAIIIGLFIAKF